MSESRGIHPSHMGEGQGDKEGLEQRIRERAFYLWQEAGRPEGGEEEFWHRAREQEEGGGSDTRQEVEQHNPNASPSAATGKAKG
jgi:hypothetical protein